MYFVPIRKLKNVLTTVQLLFYVCMSSEKRLILTIIYARTGKTNLRCSALIYKYGTWKLFALNGKKSCPTKLIL